MLDSVLKKIFSILTISLLFSNCLQAQTPIEDEIFIWDGDAPGSENVTVTEVITDRDPNGSECYLNRSVSKVVKPSIKYFQPENPNGTAVLLCPGGGYALLAYDKEGYDIAQWYNDRDVTAFVLKYRLPIDGHENRQNVPLQDVQRALRYIRANAANFGIDPDKIGVMGGSAGGHVAACASVFYDKDVYTPIDAIDTESARPDFTVLMYPVVSFQDNLTHGGSRTNLLGGTITQELKDEFSPELHVDANTPPAFMFHSKKDGSVVPGNSEAYAAALNVAGVSNSLKLYESGGHGIGMCEAGNSDFARWPYDLNNWLVEMKYTTTCEGTPPVVSISEDDERELSATGSDNYQWFRNGVSIEGANQEMYTASSSGYYTVAIEGDRLVSGTSCYLYSEEAIVDLCNGLTPSISVNEDGDLVSSRAGNIQWFLDNEAISGETDKILVIQESGINTVATINAKGISGEECLLFSDPLEVEYIALNVAIKDQPLMYPNPVLDQLTIDLPKNFSESLKYSIYDLNGKVTVQSSTPVRNRLLNLDVSSLDSGIYTLLITQTGMVMKGRFIKK